MNDQQKRARLRELLNDPRAPSLPVSLTRYSRDWRRTAAISAVHLSGNAIHKNFCLPDRNLLTTTQVAQRIGQISEATDIPLIVDGGSICAETIALTRAVKLYERAGAAAVRFEDAAVNEYGAAPEELAIAPTVAVMSTRSKPPSMPGAIPAFVVIARCDSRPKESLDQVRRTNGSLRCGRSRRGRRPTNRYRRFPPYRRHASARRS